MSVSSLEAIPAVAVVQAPETLPPVIVVLGEGEQLVTEGGVKVLNTSVVVGTEFVDPGKHTASDIQVPISECTSFNSFLHPNKHTQAQTSTPAQASTHQHKQARIGMHVYYFKRI